MGTSLPLQVIFLVSDTFSSIIFNDFSRSFLTNMDIKMSGVGKPVKDGVPTKDAKLKYSHV